jgi:hypothetical protein
MDYLVIVAKPTKLYVSTSLESAVITTAKVGDKFEFLGFTGTWSRVRHESIERYVPYGQTDYNKIVVLSEYVYNQLVIEALLYFLENNKVILFEGTIDAEGNFKIDRDFGLGDIVTIENEAGLGGKCRIVELLYSEDADNGLRVHPTFSKV